MHPVALDIVVRRVPRNSTSPQDIRAASAYEVRLQDGAWTGLVVPDDAGWAEDAGGLLEGEAGAARRLGVRLAKQLEGAGWSTCAPRVVRAIGSGRPVCVRVQAPDEATLGLPWRWLPLTAGGEPMGAHAAVELQLALEGVAAAPRTAASRRASLRGTERVLVAAPHDPVENDYLVATVRTALEAGGRVFDGQRDRLDAVTLSGIDRQLRSAGGPPRPAAVLHLQAPLEAAGPAAAGLMLRSATGQPTPMDARQLQVLLGPHAGALQLAVVLPVGGHGDAMGLLLGAHRAGVAAVVGAARPLSEGAAAVASTALYTALIAHGKSVQEAVTAAREALRGAGQRMAADALTLLAQGTDPLRPLSPRPWAGLSPYPPALSPFFVGREEDVSRVVAALDHLDAAGRPRILVLSAARGSGLRSLVHAGVVPKLLATRGGTAQTLRPGDPAAARGGERVLVAEGIGDLFGAGDVRHRAVWLKRLCALAVPKGRTTVLILVPSEVLGRCGELVIDEQGARLDSLSCSEVHHLRMTQPGPAALQRMVEEPARAAGLTLEPGLAAHIVRDLGAMRRPLPRLGAALLGLWEGRLDNRLTLAAYERQGGVSGAIASRCESALAALPGEQRALAPDVLVALCDAGPLPLPLRTVAELSRSTGAPLRLLEELLINLEEHGLVARSHATPPGYRLVSAELVAGWPRLRAWLDDARVPAAPPTTPGRPRHGGRAALIAAAALLASVVGVLGSAWAGREQAQSILRHAVDAPRADPTVAAVQLRQLREPPDPDAWALAARQVLAEPVAAGVFGPWDAPLTALRFRQDGRVALAHVGDELYLLDPRTGTERLVPIQTSVLVGAPAPDGPAVLAIDREGTFWRWDAASAPEPLHTVSEGGPVVAAFSPSGDVGLIVSQTTWTQVDPRGAVLGSGPLPLHGEVPRVAAVADGGVRHVVAGQTGSVFFWGAGDDEAARLRHPGVRRLALNAAGTHLLSLGDGRLRLTDLVRGVGVFRTPSTVRVDTAEFDASGTWLAVEYTDLDAGAHHFRRLRVDQRTDQVDSDPFDVPATSVVMNLQAGRTWRGLADGTVEERDLESGALTRTLRGHQGRVHLLSTSRDGRWLASTAGDGGLRIWPLRADAPAPPTDDPIALRAALWSATGTCAGLDAAGLEAWCACERCNGRDPSVCADIPGGLSGLLASLSTDSVCGD